MSYFARVGNGARQTYAFAGNTCVQGVRFLAHNGVENSAKYVLLKALCASLGAHAHIVDNLLDRLIPEPLNLQQAAKVIKRAYICFGLEVWAFGRCGWLDAPDSQLPHRLTYSAPARRLWKKLSTRRFLSWPR